MPPPAILDGARSRLSTLATQWPAHPARSRAEALSARLSAPRGALGASRAARGEFVFWSTLGGVLLAQNFCVMLDCSTDRERAGVYTLTAGGALAASLLATRGGIRQGEAQLYNSAQTWASWNALLVNDGFPESTEEAGVSVGDAVRRPRRRHRPLAGVAPVAGRRRAGEHVPALGHGDDRVGPLRRGQGAGALDDRHRR